MLPSSAQQGVRGMTPVHHQRKTCRLCGSRDLSKVLDLGSMPPANAFTKPLEGPPVKAYPLALYFCNACSLAQLLDVVHPEVLFTTYHYATGSSPQLQKHFADYAQKRILPLVTKEDLVVDIGGNDGTLLNFVKDHARVMNFDPASNVRDNTTIPNHVAFFSFKVAKSVIRHIGKATVITANNVLAHVDDPIDLLGGVHELLSDKGTFICEVHWVRHLLDAGCYDHIYHEHLCYYSLHNLRRAMAMVGLKIFRVEIVQTQGESLRIFACKDGREPSTSVEYILNREIESDIAKCSTFERFAERVKQSKHVLRELLGDLKISGASIVGYGAPAKGNTLLNFCGIGNKTLDYLTDTNPIKQHKLSPGMQIPVMLPERLYDDEPDYALLLAWNFTESILRNEQELRDNGTKFIIPIPALTVV
jgi:hypothetical protein